MAVCLCYYHTAIFAAGIFVHLFCSYLGFRLQLALMLCTVLSLAVSHAWPFFSSLAATFFSSNLWNTLLAVVFMFICYLPLGFLDLKTSGEFMFTSPGFPLLCSWCGLCHGHSNSWNIWVKPSWRLILWWKYPEATFSYRTAGNSSGWGRQGDWRHFPQGSLRLKKMHHQVFSSWHVLCLLDWKGYLVLKAWWTQMYFEIAVRKKCVLRKALVWNSVGYGLFGLKWSEFCRRPSPGYSFMEGFLCQPSSHFAGRETYC